MSFVGQRDSKDLQHFVDTSLQFHIMSNDDNKAISNYGTIDLKTNGIFRSSPKLLDFKVLLNPFEEQFHAPTISIEQGNQFCRCSDVIGKKDVLRTIVRVNNYDFSHFFRIILRTFIYLESTDNIRNDTGRKSPFPRSRFYSDVVIGSYDEEMLLCDL